MSKTTNKFSPEVRERAVRMVLDSEKDHPSRWAGVTSIAGKFGCPGYTLLEWVKKAEVDKGMRAGGPTELADKLKALERENREQYGVEPIAGFCRSPHPPTTSASRSGAIPRGCRPVPSATRR